MIFEKKINLTFNKKNKISTAYINIPLKGIKIMGEPKHLNLVYGKKDNEIILRKGDEGQPLIIQANGNTKLYRFTLDKDIIEKIGYKKNQLVKIDITTEQMKISFNQEERMSRIVSIINFKGGVGKTTTTHCIGSGLTLQNKKVLLIDTDPQASLTFTALSETPKLTIKDILVDQKNINDVIIETENFDLIPSNLILNLAERQLNSKFGTEKLLKKALNKLEKTYDYIIIDCPPSMNLFTINALYASDYVLIPCETELLALDGLNLLIQTLEQTEEELDVKIKNTLVLPTKLDKRKKVSKEIYEHLKENFKTTETTIRTCSKLNLLGLNKDSIYQIDSSCTATIDYKNLVGEIIKWDC
ncbi:AAA family ATPase [Candidatus Cetobacterium colombiensis]|uniref:AAA family ATPase n=1 Tax=Candidatus Cetobacterium colombiensis TaxID=3073100 RepID=A0ABU4WCK2_9FUSO|nr:AAA family ATPase [Candidatus Cetobacterium colombiensis]MDX8336115.1 AAA family ATPase [Candidatus Cetobacterium colombiensis]